MDNFISVAFTGYRKEKLPFECSNENVALLINELSVKVNDLASLGVRYFISGMCGGVDLWAAQAVLEQKKKFQIELWCAVPFDAHRSTIESADLPLYDEVIKHADNVLVLAKDVRQKEYGKAYNRRNKFMVEHSNGLIAVCNPDNIIPGGTKNTVKMAKALGKRVIFINPDSINAK